MASRQPLIREWSAQKYLPVIFRSGKENPEENTSAMLKHSREATVRREMEFQQIPQFFLPLYGQHCSSSAERYLPLSSR